MTAQRVYWLCAEYAIRFMSPCIKESQSEGHDHDMVLHSGPLCYRATRSSGAPGRLLALPCPAARSPLGKVAGGSGPEVTQGGGAQLAHVCQVLEVCCSDDPKGHDRGHVCS